MIAIFPTLFLEFSQDLLGWVYRKLGYSQVSEAIYFDYTTFSPHSGLVPKFQQLDFTHTYKHSLEAFGRALYNYFPMMLPYWVFWGLSRHYARKDVYYLFVALPLLSFLTKYLTYSYVPGVIEYFLFIFYCILFLTKSFSTNFTKGPIWSLLFIGTLVVSFFTSVFFLINSPYEQERIFVRSFLGSSFEGNLNESRKVLNVINEPGSILMDDSLNYKLPYLSANIRRFVLPYQDQFRIVLTNPAHFVKYVIVSKEPRNDDVLKRYPNAINGELDGFHLIYFNNDLLVYKNLYHQ